jgi:hypothetical protein
MKRRGLRLLGSLREIACVRHNSERTGKIAQVPTMDEKLGVRSRAMGWSNGKEPIGY